MLATRVEQLAEEETRLGGGAVRSIGAPLNEFGDRGEARGNANGRGLPFLILEGSEVALFRRVASLLEAKRAVTHGSKSSDGHCNAVGSELGINR